MNLEKNDRNAVDDAEIKEIFEKARSRKPEFSLGGSLHEMNNFNFTNPDNRLLFSSLCLSLLAVIYMFGEFVIGEELRTALMRLFYQSFWTSVLIGLVVGMVSAFWELALIKKETAYLLKFHSTDNKKRIYSFELQKKNFALNFWICLIIASLPVFALKYDLAIFPMVLSLGIPMALFNGEMRKFSEKLSSFKDNSISSSSVPVSSFAPASGSEGAPVKSFGVSDGYGFWDAFLYFSILLAFLSVIYCLNSLLPRQDTLLERSAISSAPGEPADALSYASRLPGASAAGYFSTAAIIASVVLSFILTFFSMLAVMFFKGDGSAAGKKA